MSDGGAFVVDLDGFEGPLDLLLSLARADKLDLREISIAALADQYLAYIAHVRRANLEIAAEYLVMAAWLAYLKSRLLLPVPADPDEPSGEALAEALALQLRRLEQVRALGARLMARPQRGRDVFPRGRPEALPMVTRVRLRCDLADLIAAYGRHLRRRRRAAPFVPPTLDRLYPVETAIEQMMERLQIIVGWQNLARYLPEGTLDGVRAGALDARSTLASFFVASLELARQRRLRIEQGMPFGPIALFALPGRPSDAAPVTDTPHSYAQRNDPTRE